MTGKKGAHLDDRATLEWRAAKAEVERLRANPNEPASAATIRLTHERDAALAELARVGLAVGGSVYLVPEEYEPVSDGMLRNMAAYPGYGWHVSRVSAVARELIEARATIKRMRGAVPR